MKVERIEQVFTKENELPDVRKKLTPDYVILQDKLPFEKTDGVTVKFEKQVLNFLFKNSDKFSIERVYELENMLVDGAYEKNGKLFLVEAKYALNWKNVCNARIEFKMFLEEQMYEVFSKTKKDIVRAIIVFNHFSGDWDKEAKSRDYKDGWYKFYEEEYVLRKTMLPVDIAQLTKERELKVFRW